MIQIQLENFSTNAKRSTFESTKLAREKVCLIPSLTAMGLSNTKFDELTNKKSDKESLTNAIEFVKCKI